MDTKSSPYGKEGRKVKLAFETITDSNQSDYTALTFNLELIWYETLILIVRTQHLLCLIANSCPSTQRHFTLV